MAEKTNDEAPSGEDKHEKPDVHRGWRIAVAFGLFAVFGMYAAIFIPAYAGVKPHEFALIYAIFWTGLLGYFSRKSRGLSGGMGWLIGGVIGLMVFMGGAVLRTYHGFPMSEAAWQGLVAEINEQMPLMVNDEVRADRVAWVDDGIQFHLTFIDVTAAELDEEHVRREFKEYYVSSICGTPDWKEPLARGVTITYYVVDKVGSPVSDFTINQADCHQ